MKKINGLVMSTLTAALLIGCGGGGGSSSTASDTQSGSSSSTTSTSTDVTVERGAVFGATVTDAAGQVATQKSGSNVYTFATTPVYPITASGGIIDVNGDEQISAGDVELTTVLTSYSTVVTPITTYLGDTTTTDGKTKLAKLKEISGVTNDDDLLKRVPSELSTDVIVLTNAIFEIMNDGDNTNDNFITDYDNSVFKTNFTTLKTEADKYTDKKEILKALEEKVVTNIGLIKLTADEVTNAANGTTKATLLKVADLTRYVTYDNEYWYDDVNISGNKFTTKSYIKGSSWTLDGTNDDIVTTDATNPYKASYVNSLTKEEGTFTLLSTKKVDGYTNLYKTKAKMVVTKAATELQWYRTGQENPVFTNPTTQQLVVVKTVDDLISTNLLLNGKVTKENDLMVITSFDGKEHSYFKIVTENGNYYIEQADLNDVGYTVNETDYTGNSLDDFVANITSPAPEFTSWGNTYALENQTSAYTPTVKDTLPLTYSISGGVDADKFNIDSKTGVVTFKTAPDYETKVAYSFIIKVTNSANKSSIQEVNIKITNVIESFQSGETFNGLVYNIVTSPITGIQWLDRNLGASQSCTSSADSACYGDSYQWGRLSDGHEKANAATTTEKAIDIINVGSAKIISEGDWTTADTDKTLRVAQWSKTDGTGICPVGFRVPTNDELVKETLEFAGTNNTTTGAVKVIDIPTAFQNFLKLAAPRTGDSVGALWTASKSDQYSFALGKYINYYQDTYNGHTYSGANGYWGDYFAFASLPVRCIKGN